MERKDIETDFANKVCQEIRLKPSGLGRWQVEHPFTFDDGDHYVIVLRKGAKGSWEFSDEAHTIMHLSYESLDLGKGGYKEIISNTVSAFGLLNLGGELTLPVPENRFGDALFSFIQALVKVSDVKYLERERIKSMFLEELKGFLSEKVPSDKREFDYSDPKRDPERVYSVDCLVKAKRPLFVFAINSDAKCQTATNIIYWWEKQDLLFDTMAIHENMTEISDKVLTRFTDVCGKQFSNLPTNRDRISAYIAQSFNGA